MSATEARYRLQSLKRKYRLIRLLETLLFSVAIALVVYATLNFFRVPNVWIWTSTLVSLIASYVVRSIRLKLWKISEAGVVHYMNQHYPQLEESTDLLVRDDESLTSLQQLQKRRTLQHFETLYSTVKLPHNLAQASLVFVLGVVAYVSLTAFAGKENTPSDRAAQANVIAPVEETHLPATIKRAVITFTPPAYTGLPKKSSNTFNVRVPEGTTVAWDLQFTENVTHPAIIFSAHDSLALASQGEQYNAHRQFDETLFYQIAWTNTDGSRKYSDYFTIEIVRDQPPVVSVDNLDQFISLRLTDNLKINLKSTLTDDYRVKDAYIIATVSKGSGESVKFREEKLRFDTPGTFSGKHIAATRTLDIVKLGLDPGDELYFYVEAFDNKVPKANRARTETYFISLQDTSQQTTSIDPGLGVDLMPDYFRSQRQIIIDSEKLLKEKKQLSKEVFNARSNELAYDQKVLRLRYGEFLGEEFESGIGPQVEAPAADDDEDVTKKYGHAHDTENEHNLVDDKKTAPAQAGQDHHDHAGADNDDPVKAYTHAHDSEDEATFFAQSIRSKLKAAITIMWDAELHLRLYDPQQSLPYQYKALKLLKEISQDSRIYVHRTGFDPPPLKEEKRLTGDQTELKNSSAQNTSLKTETYPNIRKAATLLEKFSDTTPIVVTPASKDILLKAGQELSAIAIAQPGRYLKSLSLLKGLAENELEKARQPEALRVVKAALWSVLPQEAASPQAHARTTHSLDDQFLKHMETLKQK
ncbi:hypothetical protein [Chryseolinea lacunae]|uniref:Tryptophan-rich sensory protein n=1 Tax=Chryseolinea lacunae TaxID=2801331 RepID=A0ABS1KU05_9BACT|nr:hypothetical protein [Chryseolinea lacunae]MBL0742884.1 hypothetical protein [Chryseolinea lacunae]